jgi:hypothetical protein
MQTNEINQLSIQDMEFSKPNEEQAALIHAYSTKNARKRFNKRFIISLIIAIVVIVGETIARYYYKNDITHSRRATIPGMIAVVLTAFVLYNLISFIWTKMKTNMDDILNRYECVCGIVTEKYDSRHLSETTREAVPNYILFSNEQGHCVTALPVKSFAKFQSVQVGDEILVLKMNPMGMAAYDFVTISSSSHIL